MRRWYKRTPDTIAVYVRPWRTIPVGANEVFVLRKDGRVADIIHEDRSQIQSILGLLASLSGFGPRVDGYIAHTDPVKLSYWTEEPISGSVPGPEAFGPPLITRDAQPIVAQVTVEVSVDPQNADQLLRVLGNQLRLTSGDLQDRFRDELRAKLGVELEKYPSEELRGNPVLLRALYDQTRQELASSLGSCGLRLDNFYISWGLTSVQIESIHRELREYRGEPLDPVQKELDKDPSGPERTTAEVGQATAPVTAPGTGRDGDGSQKVKVTVRGRRWWWVATVSVILLVTLGLVFGLAGFRPGSAGPNQDEALLSPEPPLIESPAIGQPRDTATISLEPPPAISPTLPLPRDAVTISVDIVNEGRQSGSFILRLKRQDSDTLATPIVVKSITLEPEEMDTIRFLAPPKEQGSFVVDITDVTNGFELVRKLNPADITFSGLTIKPDLPRPGSPVTIGMVVENRGDLLGQAEIEIRINGVLTELRSLSLRPGRIVPWTLEFTPPGAGLYTIEFIDPAELVAPLRGEFSAAEELESEFSLFNLQLSPLETHISGEIITANLLANNVGDVPGDLRIVVQVDGVAQFEEDFSLEELSIVPLELIFVGPDVGDHTVRVFGTDQDGNFLTSTLRGILRVYHRGLPFFWGQEQSMSPALKSIRLR